MVGFVEKHQVEESVFFGVVSLVIDVHPNVVPAAAVVEFGQIYARGELAVRDCCGEVFIAVVVAHRNFNLRGRGEGRVARNAEHKLAVFLGYRGGEIRDFVVIFRVDCGEVIGS